MAMNIEVARVYKTKIYSNIPGFLSSLPLQRLCHI
eukprot:CAMPEP_0119054780 /NCGR_PEP_ID=MMETSP1177-20130426/75306_1 /TAXON_ID=2985 /ORGANISM="Ochromonas sp, Strain CCMP1899" /LENGTH=34 /DNA_ID= /DNA_START= /DNA_END= /DNA_ORIENTATION=